MTYSNIFDPESKIASRNESTRLAVSADTSSAKNNLIPNQDAPPKTNAITVGSTLKERFIIEEEIARGGMGVVYRARDIRKVQYEDRNPHLAIKVIGEECKSHPDSFIALQREAGKAQMLAHPNIVTVYDFDSDGDTVFMTMEYLEGESLQHLFLRQGTSKLPTEQALNIIDAIGQGLAYAHQKGIVHCDLKPGNIFLTKDNNVKILDFGIARAAMHPEQFHQDATRFDPASLGALTPAYASCEMLENARPDARDDIYALACVAYEMLLGRHPFRKMPADVARDNKLKPAPIKGLTKQQWKVLSQGLAFEREKRPDTVTQFVDGLRGTKPTSGHTRRGKVMTALITLTLSAALGTYAYQTKLIAPQPQPIVTDTTTTESLTNNTKPVVLNSEQQKTIEHLLEAAEIHFMVHRVTEPEGSNAFAAYRHILEIDPNNSQAKAGLKKIADYYENLAQTEFQKGDTKKALSMIQTGLKVMPGHTGLVALKQKMASQSVIHRATAWFQAWLEKLRQ